MLQSLLLRKYFTPSQIRSTLKIIKTFEKLHEMYVTLYFIVYYNSYHELLTNSFYRRSILTDAVSGGHVQVFLQNLCPLSV